MWLGVSIHSGDREFMIPPTYEVRTKSLRVDEKGNRYIRVVGVRWFTNLDYPQRYEELVSYKKYTPEEYPKFDNYNAINVNKTSDIPCDYYGVMGVPITFMDKYNPKQFEIIWRGGDIEWAENECDFYTPPTPQNAAKYKREDRTWRIQNPYLLDERGSAHCVYQRVFIRRKKQ